jgi:hypothetical protein
VHEVSSLAIPAARIELLLDRMPLVAETSRLAMTTLDAESVIADPVSGPTGNVLDLDVNGRNNVASHDVPSPQQKDVVVGWR